MIYSSFMSM